MKFSSKSAAAVLSVFFAVSCSGPSVRTESFGKLSTGEEVSLFRLSNGSGAYVEITDYGCRIVGLHVPDRKGRLGDVIVGYGDISSFETGSERFFGAVIGRYGNRIDGAEFVLDGKTVSLSANEELGGRPVHIHGGFKGFDRVLWDAETIVEDSRAGVRFSRVSPDGEEGYPGNLSCSVTYWWTEDNVLRIEYGATTDAPTVVNMSNHAFFNLKGEDGGYVMDHLLQVESDFYIQNTEQFVPDLILPVDGSPFDFREPHRVDYRTDMPNEHLRIMHGFSACWILRGDAGGFARAGSLYEPRSGRGVEIWTDEPGLLTYTGRTFNESVQGKYGPVEKFGGMLLETLHFADSPNQPRFPSTVLRPGETYSSVTEFRFYAE